MSFKKKRRKKEREMKVKIFSNYLQSPIVNTHYTRNQFCVLQKKYNYYTGMS